MRRTKLLAAAGLLAAVMLVGASPATAGIAMRTSLTGVVTGMNTDPQMVAERCPPGSPQAIVGSSGSGTLTSEAYTGLVTFTEEHCTLILAARSDGLLTVAYIRAGVMELVAPSGTLTLSFSAPGVLKGDLFVGPNVHTLNGPYTITGGTGDFEGATGHGRISGTAANPGGFVVDVTIDLVGTLAVP